MNKEVIDYKSAYENVLIANNMLRKENKELHNKMVKAIEYIKELYDNTDDITCYDIDRNTRHDLLEILKDSDVDE